MKKEKAHCRYFLSLAPQETCQEYTVKNIFSNVDTVGEGEGAWIGRLALAYIHYPQCKAAVYMGSTTLCSVMTSGVGWDGDGRQGGFRGRRYMHTYSWTTLLHSRNLRQYCKAIILQENIQTKTVDSRSYQAFSSLEIHWQEHIKYLSSSPFRYQMKPLTSVFNHWNLKTIAVLSHGVALSEHFAGKKIHSHTHTYDGCVIIMIIDSWALKFLWKKEQFLFKKI